MRIEGGYGKKIDIRDTILFPGIHLVGCRLEGDKLLWIHDWMNVNPEDEEVKDHIVLTQEEITGLSRIGKMCPSLLLVCACYVNGRHSFFVKMFSCSFALISKRGSVREGRSPLAVHNGVGLLTMLNRYKQGKKLWE